jgi:hypothetical protein
MIKSVFIAICFLLTFNANATSQFGDILIWNGDTLALFSNPLEFRSDWDELSKTIHAALLKEDMRLYPEKYEGEEVELMFSSACWRGYVAEWQIIEDKIYLSNIFSCMNYNVKVDIKKVFPAECDNGFVFGDWVCGELVVPKGPCIKRINPDYKSVYEKEIVFMFQNGILANLTAYKNYVAKESGFSMSTNLYSLPTFLYSNINWDQLPSVGDAPKQVSVGIQPDKDGQIDSVLWENTYMIDESKIVVDSNNVFIKEALRIARLIPDWDVIYQRGKIVSTGLFIDFHQENRNRYAH